MMLKIATGRTGEDKAVAYLKQQGYKIIKRNFKNRLGEIDVVARDGETICFIEVRTREGLGHHAESLESVGRFKQQRLSKVALSFLKANNLIEHKARFDIVSVSLSNPVDSFLLIKDAFPVIERYH